jgi:hypothetical protein
LLWFFPLATIAAGLVTMAVLQRNAYLAFWAVTFGVVGTLEQYYVLSNRLGGLVTPDLGQPIVYGALGVLLLVAGLVARRREGRGDRPS